MATATGMRMACAVAALLFASRATGAEACVEASVGIDAAHREITMELALPKGVDELALAPFDGYERSALLRSADGSVLVSNDSLRPARPGLRMALALDVRENLPQRDRAYAPFLRFADGTVAFDSELLAPAAGAPPLCLRFVPPHGQKAVGFGKAVAGALRAPGDGRRGGYVAFGDPRIEDTGAMLEVFDRTTPDWAVQRLDAALDRVVEYYRRWLPPIRLPAAFVYRMSYPPGTGGIGSHGDRLPESLTLGLLGNDWSAPQDEALLPLTGFIGHEVFHLWNAANGMVPAGTHSMLAQEGGAELAGMFVAASLGGGESAWLDAATDALDTCLASLPESGLLADADLAHGRLPYDCGVPAMLALAAANDRGDPAAGYFNAWKRVVERGLAEPDLRYRWDELAEPGTDPRVLAALRGAIDGRDGYEEGIRDALTFAGFTLVPNDRLSASLRSRFNQQLVAALMARDCDGVVDLWSESDGFRVGGHASACLALQPNRTVVAVLGMRLASDDPVALGEAIRTRCQAGAKVDVRFADGATAPLECPAEFPRLPAMWRITAPP